MQKKLENNVAVSIVLVTMLTSFLLNIYWCPVSITAKFWFVICWFGIGLATDLCIFYEGKDISESEPECEHNPSDISVYALVLFFGPVFLIILAINIFVSKISRWMK